MYSHDEPEQHQTTLFAFTGPPPKRGLPDIDEVHVSVTFTYDMEKAHQLAEQWQKLGVPVHMGGPAFQVPGGDFIPGMYLEKRLCNYFKRLSKSLLVLQRSEARRRKAAGAAYY